MPWARPFDVRPLQLGRRLVEFLGPTGDAARQSLVALGFNSCSSLVAGAALGSVTGTFERFPGLLLMVPAAIGLRGNIFGALGNRLSTSIHAGTFHLSVRRESVLVQNVLASLSLTFGLSLLLAVIVKVVAVGFDVPDTIPLLDLALVSLLGGLIASVFVLGVTVALSIGAVRREWDLDNLVAPTVSTLGDVVTIPALVIATTALGHGTVTTVLGWVLVVLALATVAASVRAKLEVFSVILRESVPVLAVALVLSTLAGYAIERQLSVFTALPALLVLQPAFVSSAGSLGGILSSRVGTNLHLGLVQPEVRPSIEAQRDALLVLLIGLPVFLFNGVGAHVVARVLGHESPGLVMMVLATLIGGLAAVLFVIALAYYGTIAAWRVHLDPDTYGIPVVTASVDFVGVVALVVTVLALGIA
ncbi:MAG TPA: magnesium transporter [Microthrixaceae bacterium]|nr:magnesium transporter [Microthrixaceae bacterium]